MGTQLLRLACIPIPPSRQTNFQRAPLALQLASTVHFRRTASRALKVAGHGSVHTSPCATERKSPPHDGSHGSRGELPSSPAARGACLFTLASYVIPATGTSHGRPKDVNVYQSAGLTGSIAPGVNVATRLASPSRRGGLYAHSHTSEDSPEMVAEAPLT